MRITVIFIYSEKMEIIQSRGIMWCGIITPDRENILWKYFTVIVAMEIIYIIYLNSKIYKIPFNKFDHSMIRNDMWSY